MRKHFLILMLFALLPYVAWGAVVSVRPYNVTKYYGQADPTGAGLIYDVTTPADWATALGTNSELTQARKNAILRAGLQISRNGVNAGEAVGDYTYTLQFKKANALAAAVISDNPGANQFTAAMVTTFIDNYNVGVNGTSVLSIEKMPLVGADETEGVTVAVIPAQVYDGTAKTPALTVTNNGGGAALVLGTDYTVTWANNTEVGTNATVTLTGIGSYTGSTQKTFRINPGLAQAVITLQNYPSAGYTYNGAAQAPNFTVKVGDATLTKGTHYNVSYFNTTTETANDNTNAGTIKIILSGVDDQGYTGTNETTTFVINPKAVEAVTWTSIAGGSYTGSPINPTFTGLKADNLDVTEADYTITSAATNVSAEAKATLQFKRNFSGTKEVTYAITAKNITLVGGTSVTLDQTTATTTANTYTWKNALIQPDVIALDGTATIPAANLDVTYYNWNGTSTSQYTNDIGQKRAVVSAKAGGNYAFNPVNLDYSIVKAPLTITINDLNVGYGVAIAPTLKFEGLVDGNTTKNAINNKIGTGDNQVYYQFWTTGANSSQENNIDAAVPGTYKIKFADADKATLAALGNGGNYEITWVEGTLVKSAAQVVVKIENNSIEYGDAFPHTGWTVSHVSGLSAEQAQNIGTFVNIAGIQNNFKLVTDVDGVLDVNATGYDVMYKDGDNPDNVIVNNNYLITVQTGKLIVGKKKITTDMIAIADNNLKYTAAAVHPAVTINHPLYKANGNAFDAAYTVPAGYFITDYDASFNAGQRKAHISVASDNAYYFTETKVLYTNEDAEVIAGTKHVGDLKETLPYTIGNYTIHPLEIKITADNFTGAKAWTYGTKEPDYTAKATNKVNNSGDVAVEAAKIAALLKGEEVEGFNGTLKIKRVGADGVGTWTGALKPVIVDAQGNELGAAYNAQHPAADNYTITFVNGNLEIKKGSIKVKVKDVVIAYGVDLTNSQFYLEPTTDMGSEAADFENIVNYSHTPADYGYVYNGNNGMKAIGYYTLSYKSTADAPTATNYDIEFDTDDTGTLEVTTRPIKLKAKDANKTLTQAANFNPTVINDVVVVDENGFYGFADDDSYATLIKSIKVESKEIGTNDITLTAKTASESAHVANYAITLVPGVLTVTSDNSVATITLNRVLKEDVEKPHVNTAARLIEQNAGEYRNVNFSDFAMIAEKWYPLVLPFATSVKDISAAFGYAVVDVFDGTTAEGKIKFKLHMGDIEANTPFIVKVFENQNMNDVTKYYGGIDSNTDKVKFANVKIVNGMDENKEVKVGNASDVQFVGNYNGKTDGFRSYMYYFSEDATYGQYYKGNDTNKTYLRPLGAYFVDNAANAANMLREILIEEPNGSTTAISAITVDGAFVEADGWYTTNGVKLQGVPTEKGVYIRNGKKIVIK